MKSSPILLGCLLMGASPCPAADQVVCLGDSLTFAYEAEFCFEEVITGLGTIGEGFDPAKVKNWIEILNDPTYRGAFFDIGARDDFTVDPPLDPAFTKFFRHEYNWAIPGLKVDGMRRFLEAEDGFLDLLGEVSSFAAFAALFDDSDFLPSDFALTDLQDQVQNSAERVVIFVGGNDIREIYSTVYGGGSAGTFVADFMADMTDILDVVQGWNATIPIVLVNVPHVGITPRVREDNGQPPDPTGVGHVAAVLSDLNSQLRALAEARGIGYADIYTPTVHMALGDAYDLVIHGIVFGNTFNNGGGLNRVWLNNDFADFNLSNRFHPNTSGQAVIANEIIHAFNRRYGDGIAPLTATEMLEGLLEKNSTQVDMDFATWHAKYYLPGTPPIEGIHEDIDFDGLPAGVEFSLGLHPRLRDADRVLLGKSGGSLELAYPLRLTSSAEFTLTPVSAPAPGGPYTPLPAPSPDADGLARALLPIGPGDSTLSLRSEIP